LLVQRQKGNSAAFVWAISIDGAPVQLRSATVKGASGSEIPSSTALAIEVSSANEKTWIVVNPTKQAIIAETPGAEPIRTVAPFTLRKVKG
jgi:hypothetical protein